MLYVRRMTSEMLTSLARPIAAAVVGSTALGGSAVVAEDKPKIDPKSPPAVEESHPGAELAAREQVLADGAGYFFAPGAGELDAIQSRSVAGARAGDQAAQMKEITQRVFTEYQHYRPEDAWLKTAALEIKIERLGSKNVSDRAGAEKHANRLDGRHPGVWPIDERPELPVSRAMGANSFLTDLAIGLRPELYRISVEATGSGKSKSYEGVVFAMPAGAGPRIMPDDIMRRMYPTAAEPSDVAKPGQERKLSASQLAQIEARSVEWFATNRDARYDAARQQFTEIVHPGGYESGERVSGDLQDRLADKAWQKVSQYGLRDHDNEWVTKDQIALGPIAQDGSKQSVSFSVLSKTDPTKIRATGTIQFTVEGTGVSQRLRYSEYALKNVDLSRKDMGEVGVPPDVGIFGDWLERAHREKLWGEMKNRGLVMTDFDQR